MGRFAINTYKGIPVFCLRYVRVARCYYGHIFCFFAVTTTKTVFVAGTAVGGAEGEEGETTIIAIPRTRTRPTAIPKTIEEYP